MNIFLYLLQVTICLAAFYGFYLLALQKETTFRGNRFYLLLSMLISLMLPLLKIYMETIPEPISTPVFVGGMIDSLVQAVVIAPKPSGVSWAEICISLYLVGIVGFALRFLMELLRLNALRANGMQQMISGHRCIVSAKIKTPFSFFNTIYLPAKHGFSSEELREVIVHEHSHIKEKHSLDVVCMEIFCIALWISPVIYLYRKKLREVHEYLADAAVIQNTPWEQYAKLLVAQTHHGLQSHLTNQLIYSQLKNRLVMMTQKPSTMLSRLKYSGVLPIVCIAIILFSIRDKVSLQENATVNYAGDPFGKVIVTAFAPPVASDEEMKDSGVYRINAIPNSSIQVSAAGRLLKEDQDYTINQDMGTLRIINPDFLKPEIPISISFKGEGKMVSENQAEDNTEQPIFPGCEKENLMVQQECSHKKLFEYVAQHLNYPEELKASKIEGKVYVKFVVGLNGLLGTPWIQKSLHPAADQAALDVVSSMNKEVGKWTPGSKEGIPVSMELVLPISFVLGDMKKEMPMQMAEVMPRFPGCEIINDESKRSACANEKFMKYVYENIKYPAEDRKNGKEGQVMARFVINANGSIGDVQIIKGVSEGIDNEVLRLINAMNDLPERWTPGMDKGKVVAVEFTMPVSFVLQEDRKQKARSETPKD